MARKKHSRALFEVIKQTQARQQQERAPGDGTPFSSTAAPATRSSWLSFLRRGTPAGTDRPKPVVARVVQREVPPPHNVPDLDADDQPTAPTGASDAEHQATDASAIGNAASDIQDAGELNARTDEPNQPVEAVEVAERSQLNVAGEPETQSAFAIHARHRPRGDHRPGQVTFTLTYPTLAVASLAAILLLITAFLAGKHFARPAWPGGPTLTQIKNGKAFPDVLNVGSAAPRSGAGAETVAAIEANAPAPQVVPPAEPAPREERAETAAPDTRRIAGRHYIIAQSYPDRDIADKAAELLNRNNIPVSVEQLDFAPGWHCVVTRVGFDRIKTSEFERYDKLIRDVNAQAVQARIKKFDPYPYKWK